MTCVYRPSRRAALRSVTEVLTTSAGEKPGLGYGGLLDRLSEETMETGRARNKLFQLARKADARGDAAKASRIRRHNLGRKKLRVKRHRGEAAVKSLVGQAVRQALCNRPVVVAVEDLSHLRGRTKSRKLSRIVSRWARSVWRERLEFRTRAGGSRLETVNAAFTSQMCPDPACGFVHKDNRHGDTFHCLHCGWDGDADVVAALNLLTRKDDAEIRRWMRCDAFWLAGSAAGRRPGTALGILLGRETAHRSRLGSTNAGR